MKSKTPPPSESTIQGEGDYRSAESYSNSAHEFAQSGKVEQAARDAAPRNQAEKNEMSRAEAEGRSRAKGKAPGTTAKPAQSKSAKRTHGIDPLEKKAKENVSKSRAARSA